MFVPERRKWKGEASQMLQALAREFGVPRVVIESSSQRACIARVRWAAWHVLRGRGWSYPKCGELTGGWHHASVISGVRRLTDEDRARAEGAVADVYVDAHAVEMQRREAAFRENCNKWRRLCGLPEVTT